MKKRIISMMMALALVLALPGAVTEVNAYTIDADGGQFTAEVRHQFYIRYAQYSGYDHPDLRHYANAMMNNDYSGRSYANAGSLASAQTNWYTSYNDHRSYYGF